MAVYKTKDGYVMKGQLKEGLMIIITIQKS